MKLVIVIIVIYAVQVLVSVVHAIDYKRTMREVIRDNVGFLAVGVNQNNFFKRSIVIMTINDTKVITDCRVLSGISLTSSFKKKTELIGKPLNYLEDNISKMENSHSFNQAVVELKYQFENQ